MYYKNYIEKLREKIKLSDPSVKAKEYSLLIGRLAPRAHLLWMMREIEYFDTHTIEDATKAARWIGWVASQAELHKLFSNEETRDLIREDLKQGFTIPH